MSYDFYLDRIKLPVTPSKLSVKIKGQNKTLTLINEGEINILKRAGLTDISFTALLPNSNYPFADSGNAGAVLEELERLKNRTDDKGKFMPFRFKVTRVLPNGKVLFTSDFEVSLENYSITEDVKQGFDVSVDINLRQYRAYGTKIITVMPDADGQQVATAETQRPVDKEKPASYTVLSGDSLWAIAQKTLGDGARYPEIYEKNKAEIDAGNAGTGNIKYTIYPGQTFALP
jgi:hypothetical protein